MGEGGDRRAVNQGSVAYSWDWHLSLAFGSLLAGTTRLLDGCGMIAVSEYYSWCSIAGKRDPIMHVCI